MIHRRRLALAAPSSRHHPSPLPLATGRILPLLDERLRLVVNRSDCLRVYRDGQELWLYAPQSADGKLTPVLESWYRSQAWLHLPGRLLKLAKELGTRPTKLTIRSQQTVWGSCSARGTISLNWRLVLLPTVLADYVLAHELCHLRHLDHSSDFWALLSTLDPVYRQHRAALNQTRVTFPP